MISLLRELTGERKYGQTAADLGMIDGRVLLIAWAGKSLTRWSSPNHSFGSESVGYQYGVADDDDGVGWLSYFREGMGHPERKMYQWKKSQDNQWTST